MLHSRRTGRAPESQPNRLPRRWPGSAPPEVPVSDPQRAVTPPEGSRAGVGAADLVTESTDPAELRALLARARERLSFYEGFDRLISENIRRSGELMLETLSIRDQVAAGSSRAERERLAVELDDVARRIGEIDAMVRDLAARVSTLREGLGGQPPTPAPAPPAPTPQPDVAEAHATDDWPAPRSIDVIAHQVPRATDALALQQYLAGLEPVARVEAREFAEGILRLEVISRRPLRAGDLAGWGGTLPLALLRSGATTVELSLGGGESRDVPTLHK